jgi:hypothetical protein
MIPSKQTVCLLPPFRGNMEYSNKNESYVRTEIAISISLSHFYCVVTPCIYCNVLGVSRY